MVKRYELSQQQRERIEPLLPGMIDSTLVKAHQQAATGKGRLKIRLWGVSEVD